MRVKHLECGLAPNVGGTAEVLLSSLCGDEGFFVLNEKHMKEAMQRLREASLRAILESDNPDALEALRVKYLGKKAS